MSNYKITFEDLQIEIEIHETRINEMEREREFLRKSMYANAPKFNPTASYEGDRVQGGLVPLPLDKIIERLNKIDDSLSVLYEILNEKKKVREKIERMIEQMEGLEYKVAYMRDMKGMKLQQIADELGYSHDHIRRVSSRIKKMPHRSHRKVDKKEL